jgi:hypothetical protein
VAGLQDAPVFLSQPGETFRALRRFGDRFFDENINAGFEQARSDRFVRNGRRGDDGGIDLTEHVINTRAGAFDVRINNGREFDIEHLTDDPDVMAAEGAGPDDSDAKYVHSGGYPAMAMSA